MKMPNINVSVYQPKSKTLRWKSKAPFYLCGSSMNIAVVPIYVKNHKKKSSLEPVD